MRYLLFGTGDYYNRYKKWFSKDEIVALLDNSKTKQNTLIDGIKVCSPEEGIKLGYDKIIILSFYVKAMKQQLLELGVAEKCILHFYDLHHIIDVKKFPNNILYFRADDAGTEDESGLKKVLLLSQDLTLGGPSIALMHVAEVLHRRGVSVVYGSMLNGPLREKLLKKGISVVVDERLQIATMNEIDWVQDFSLILCNTINFHVFLSSRNTDIPIAWWLHDSLFFYDGIRQQVLENIDRNNLQVLSVGPVPKKAIQNFLPDLEVGELLYGVEDVSQMDIGRVTLKNENKDKICFVTIGYIEARKGQDILLAAITKLPGKERERAIFYLVGQDSSVMAQQIKCEIDDVPEMVVTGVVSREKIDEILESADVLLCPSREDPMPTVAAEAMMHAVPCIVSDATGTASYIEDGVDGLVFASEAVDELAQKIEWCIINRDKLTGMGSKARGLYEKVFSMKAFEKNLLKVMGADRLYEQTNM